MNFLLHRYLSLLSDKYNTVKKKLDESGKSDETKSESESAETKTKKKSGSSEYPLTLENENFNPVSDDFKAGDENEGEIIEGSGRCRALNTFDTDDESYKDMPGYYSGCRLMGSWIMVSIG